MRLEQIRYMIDLAHTKSFTVSAKTLFIAQSTLSEAIAKLEDELGGRLLYRSNKGVELTALGSCFVLEGQMVLDTLDHLYAAIAAEKNKDKLQEKRELRIGAFPLTNSIILPNAISEFQKKYHEVRVVNHEMQLEQLMAALESASIDFALMNIIAYNQSTDRLAALLSAHGLCAQELYAENLEVIMSSSHPLANAKEIALAEVIAYPLTIFSSFYDKERVLHALLKAHSDGQPLDIVLNTNNLSVYKSNLINCMGISIATPCLTAEILSSDGAGGRMFLKSKKLVEKISHRYFLVFRAEKKWYDIERALIAQFEMQLNH